jgi:hypothetical protein
VPRHQFAIVRVDAGKVMEKSWKFQGKIQGDFNENSSKNQEKVRKRLEETLRKS